MPVLARIQTGVPELFEQSRLVAENYGGFKTHWFLDMVWCLLRYGARPIDYVRFEFHKKSAHERNRYLTIYRYFRILKKVGYLNEATHGKINEYKTFSDYIKRPWMVADEYSDPKSIRDFISKHGVVFAKPNMGDQGKGVRKLLSDDSKAIEELLNDCKKDSFVVEGAIQNAPEIAAINPSSLNTVRITTLTDNNADVKILSVILRAGAPLSHVDNWGAGGVGYNFNLETGVCDQYGKDKKNKKYVFHPGSNVQMIGFKLPQFDEVKGYVVQLAKLVPQAKYIGWDVAITPNGFDLVEMNCPAGHDMFQSFNNPVYDLIKAVL